MEKKMSSAFIERMKAVVVESAAEYPEESAALGVAVDRSSAATRARSFYSDARMNGFDPSGEMLEGVTNGWYAASGALDQARDALAEASSHKWPARPAAA